jgi:hypothetical protein
MSASYDVTTQTTKVAWKRDPDVPAGKPALGRFDCLCGSRITDVEFGGPDRTCDTCGRTYDGHGWIISGPA